MFPFINNSAGNTAEPNSWYTGSVLSGGKINLTPDYIGMQAKLGSAWHIQKSPHCVQWQNCDERFQYKYQLRSHMSNHCTNSSSKASEKRLNMHYPHMKTHTGKEFWERVCRCVSGAYWWSPGVRLLKKILNHKPVHPKWECSLYKSDIEQYKFII